MYKIFHVTIMLFSITSYLQNLLFRSFILLLLFDYVFYPLTIIEQPFTLLYILAMCLFLTPNSRLNSPM